MRTLSKSIPADGIFSFATNRIPNPLIGVLYRIRGTGTSKSLLAGMGPAWCEEVLLKPHSDCIGLILVEQQGFFHYTPEKRI